MILTVARNVAIDRAHIVGRLGINAAQKLRAATDLDVGAAHRQVQLRTAGAGQHQ